MALTDFEHKRCEHLLESWLQKQRPPEHIRAQLDYGYTVSGQTIELLEIRPAWDDPARITRRAFARMTFVRAQNVWKLYWMRGTGKWHPYEPSTYKRLEGALEQVQLDPMGCFYG